MSVGVFICIVYIMPTIHGNLCQLVFSLVMYLLCQQFGGYMSVGVFIGIYHANNWEDVCQLVYSLVLYISCKQLGGCMSVGVFICIVYIMPTIHGNLCQLVFSLVMYLICQQFGGCTVGVFIGIVYIMPGG